MNPKTNSHCILYILSLLFLLFSHQELRGQKLEKTLDKANRLYEAGNFSKAARQYEKAIEMSEYNEYAFLQLSRCLVETEDYSAAELYFSEIFVQSDTVDPIFFLEFGELLMTNNKPEEARSYFMSYNNLMENNDERVLRYISSIEDRDKFFTDSSFIEVRKLSVNSNADDYAPNAFQGRLYFISNREKIGSEPKLKSVHYAGFSGSSMDKETSEVKGERLKSRMLTDFSIAPATQEIFYTYVAGDQSGAGTLMEHAQLEEIDNRTMNSVQLLIEGFSGHIHSFCVNRSGTLLIFAAASGRGDGNLDLYSSRRNATGFDPPESMPGFINTLGNEISPFILEDTLLFFASDGHGGMGNYDLFPESVMHYLSIQI